MKKLKTFLCRSQYFFIIGLLSILYLLLPFSAQAEFFISEDVNEDTVWSVDQSPYIIENSIAINKDATLTINPGVVVKFMDSTSVGVFGKIQAQGEGENRVVFTSFYDDEYGGDTDIEEGFEEAEDIEASVGDWEGIYFLSEDSDSSFEDVLLRFGSVGLSLQNTYLKTKNIEIENGLDGIEIRNSKLEANDLKISNVTRYGLVAYDASTLKGGNLHIESIDYPVNILSNSSVDFKSIEIINSNKTAISIFNKSNLETESLNISKVDSGYGLEIFNEASIVSDFLYIDGVENSESVILFNNSTLSSKKANIKNGQYGVVLFNGGNLDLSNGEISGFEYSAVEVYNSDEPYNKNQISFDLMDIKANDIGLGVYTNNSEFILKRISVYDNVSFGALVFSSEILDFANVWWGDKTGPLNEIENPEGKGNAIYGDVFFIPFLKNKPAKNVPLIIIPGITGSYLYKNYDDEKEIWPNVNKIILPFGDTYLNDLALDSSGKENKDFPMRVGDIIRNARLDTLLVKQDSHIFDYFIDYFLNNGYEEGKDLFVFPYDWRFSNVDTAMLLNDKINQIILDTGVEKVDIASHSMGGIVTKTFIRDFGNQKLNKVVFMGTPHLGAPKGAKALLYGDDLGIKALRETVSVLNQKRIKFISQNMPAIYELIPSRKYFSVGNGYLKILGGDIDFMNYEESVNFLFSKEINQPLYTKADVLHSSIDDIDFGDIDVSNVSGCGGGTIARLDIIPEKNIGPFKFKEDFDLSFTNGDTTVPLVSANGVDVSDKYFVNNISHGEMPSSGSIPELAYKIIKDEDTSTFSKDDSVCTPIEGDILSKHSPIDLHIYDENENHAGPDEYGNIENSIPGVVYELIEDKAFVYLPKGSDYRIEGDATDNGDFDLAIKNVNGDTVNYTRYWQGVDINTNSQIKLFINSGTYSSVVLDSDGDSEYETTLTDFKDLDKNQSYLDYAYDEFINEHQSEEGVSTFGSMKKKEEIEIEIKNPILGLNIFLPKNIIEENKTVDVQNVLENQKENEVEKNKEIEGERIQNEIIEENNPLIAQVGETNIPSRTISVILSFSTLCLITALVKRYYFKVK